MRIIKIDLSKDQISELRQLQRKFGDYRSERALAVLHCNEGMTATEIASILKRRINTVCNWLNAFIKNGINGLSRNFSEGRPSIRKLELIPKIEEYMKKTPKEYGFGEITWSIKLFKVLFEKDMGKSISEDTVRRALHDAGYSFKRPKKTVPREAPSKEEKIECIQEIITDITELSQDQEVEMIFLDESHFSTEPYVTRGWSKKGKPFFPRDPKKT